jgi:hypothetical protein|tara:strand:- start:636 stop:1508 length:873 start_codon:yes stop_codon:yes gene_type:complete
MSKRVKHSKIKNTGILFELLSRQITQDIISDDKKSKSIDLLKKYFNENTEIGRENQLYQVLVKTNYNSTAKAQRLIEAVLKSRSKINNKKLKNEKYNLIKSISENYKTEDFFRSRIPNYKVYASVYKLFLSESIESLNPLDEVDSNFTIIEHITGKKIPSSVKDDTEVIKEFKGQDKDLRLLSYQLMVDNFNKKYKTLNTPQKNLLKEYINNISNTNSLREFVNDEVQNIKTTLESHVPNISDDITRIKLQEAVNQIENLTKGRIVKDKQVISLMRYYELIKELDNVRSK